MRNRLTLLAVGALLATATACSDERALVAPEPEAPVAATTDAAAELRQTEPFVPGRLLARFTPGAAADRVAAQAGASVQRPLVLGIVVLSVPEGAEARVQQALERNPNVEFVERDWIRTFGQPSVMPTDDPYSGYKWDLDNDGFIYGTGGSVLASTGAADADMDWREAVESAPTAGGTAVIGIMDTGIRSDHVEFTGRIEAQYDFYAGDGSAEDDNGHGSHVAGIAAAATDDGAGVPGVAYAGNVKFAIAKVCGPSGFGPFVSYGCPTSAIAEGITWAVDNGAHVLNLSLGGGTGSTTTRTALQHARANGVLPFCASGNDNGAVSYPGAWPECVAVGATDWSDNRASYSNYGPEVELSAPGGDDENANGYSYILSAYHESSTSYVFMAGTSMASPQAAGLGALLHVFGVTDDDDKLARMKSTADDLGASGRDDAFGEGRINVFAAIDGLGGGGGTTNSPPAASFIYSCTDLACSFDGSGSTDSDGTVATYVWNFGDGATATGATVSHTYGGSGTYTVTLTVTDDDGATDASSQSVTVSEATTDSPPTASFTDDCADLACSFDGSASSDDGSIVSYGWTFGDGSTGTGVTTSHTYAAGGTYTVTLTVTDDAGQSDSESRSVTVSEPTSGGIDLSATAYKVRGLHTVDLTWTGATSTNVDVYRDGSWIAPTANDGSYTDSMNNRGGGSYSYQICEAGTTTCSNTVTVTF